MGSLSLAHPMLGQDAPQMPDGNALALFNDFGYDIPEMSSNITGTWSPLHNVRLGFRAPQ